MTARKHARRGPIGPAVVGAAAGVLTALVLAPAPVAFAQVRDAAPVPPAEVEIGTAIRVSVDDPVPHPPPVLPGRPVAKAQSPCKVKAAQASATLDELRVSYRTPRALELAEDAGLIAQVLYRECGFDR